MSWIMSCHVYSIMTAVIDQNCGSKWSKCEPGESQTSCYKNKSYWKWNKIVRNVLDQYMLNLKIDQWIFIFMQRSWTFFLVVDKTCEEYHKEHGIVVKSSLSYVKTCSNDNNTNDVHENVYNDEDDEMIDTRNSII